MVTPGKEKLFISRLLSCLIRHPDRANSTGISGGIDQSRDLMQLFHSTLNLMGRLDLWADKNYKDSRFAHRGNFLILSIYPCIIETFQNRAFQVREKISPIGEGLNCQESERIGRLLISSRKTGLISGFTSFDSSFRASAENEGKSLPERGYDHLNPIISSPWRVYRENCEIKKHRRKNHGVIR